MANDYADTKFKENNLPAIKLNDEEVEAIGELIKFAGIALYPEKTLSIMETYNKYCELLDDIGFRRQERQVEIESRQADVLMKFALIRYQEAKNSQEQAKADLIIWAVKQLPHLQPSLQAYVISSVVNPSGKQMEDFEMQERLRDIKVKEAKAEADKKKYQADKERTSAEQQEFDAQLSRGEWKKV